MTLKPALAYRRYNCLNCALKLHTMNDSIDLIVFSRRQATNGRAYDTVFRPSVCRLPNVCIVAKGCVVEQKLLLTVYSHMKSRSLPK